MANAIRFTVLLGRQGQNAREMVVPVSAIQAIGADPGNPGTIVTWSGEAHVVAHKMEHVLAACGFDQPKVPGPVLVENKVEDEKEPEVVHVPDDPAARLEARGPQPQTDDLRDDAEGLEFGPE
jgi:hypothetical protein